VSSAINEVAVGSKNVMTQEKNLESLEDMFQRLTEERRALEQKLRETEGVLKAIDEKMDDFKKRQAIRMEADKNISAETNRRMSTDRGSALRLPDDEQEI
jgi:predicted RNase H-like nuclease (RuvC/YqgF family)